MDPKKAFGIEQALGKALAEADALEAVRATEDAAAFRAVLARADVKVPPALVDEYLAGADAAWPKTRAKLLLAIKLAQGTVQRATDHKGGRGIRPG